MKVLVLGGCGFIGSHVVDRLLALGHSVRVFDRQAERYRSPLPNVEYTFGDFDDRMAVAESLTGIDAVLHLISTSFPGTADLDPKLDVQGNLVSTIALLDIMVSLKVQRIIFLSSGGTVYGIPEQVPIPEDHPLRPINSYGIVKVAIESYLNMYGRTRGLSTLSIRAANPYGPRQGHTGVQGVISTFLRKLYLGEPIEIWGDGSVVRDYVHVADLAELCGLAADSDFNGVVNGGAGVGLSISDIITEMEAVSGRPINPIYRPGRAIDVPYSVLDGTRARETFGWSASTPFPEGLAATWEWMQKSRPATS